MIGVDDFVAVAVVVVVDFGIAADFDIAADSDNAAAAVAVEIVAVDFEIVGAVVEIAAAGVEDRDCCCCCYCCYLDWRMKVLLDYCAGSSCSGSSTSSLLLRTNSPFL